MRGQHAPDGADYDLINRRLRDHVYDHGPHDRRAHDRRAHDGSRTYNRGAHNVVDGGCAARTTAPGRRDRRDNGPLHGIVRCLHIVGAGSEVSVRLRTSFETAGFSADVGGVSLVPFPQAGDDAAALVIEVRNREDSADDTSPGYDLVVVMRPDQSGSWAVTSATRQTICRRGVAFDTDPPLCI